MVNFPDSLDDDDSLYAVVNNRRTRLTDAVSDSDTTIPVITTSGFPATGYLTILTGSDITKAEAIKYDTYTATEFTGVTRGADGTEAFLHRGGDNVDFTVVAEHHNSLREATIALEAFVGVSGSENFTARDHLTGDTYVDGNLTVSGTSSFCDDVDMKDQLTVTGTSRFGQQPISTLPLATMASGTVTVFTTLSSSWQNEKLVAEPLSAGVHLVMYRGNMGLDPSSANNNISEIRMQFASTEEAQGSTITNRKVGHAHGTEIAGFKVITGNGNDYAQIDVRHAINLSITSEYGAMAIASIPFDEMGLVEGTDYWFENGTATPINASSSTWTDKGTPLNFSVTDPGDYLILFSAEIRGGIEGRGRFELDGSNSGLLTQSETGSSQYCPAPGAVIRTLSAGAHTVQFQMSVNTAFLATGDARRIRMCVVRAASFDQIKGVQSDVDQSTSSANFSVLTDYTQTYTPNQTEQVVIIGSAGHFSSIDNASASYRITNVTEGENYVEDSGQRVYNATGVSDDTLNRSTMMFHILDGVDSAREFQLQFRNPSDGNSTTNTDGSLILWGLSLPAATPDVPITTIDSNVVTTHSVSADEIEALNLLTVSGVPVMHQLPDPAKFNTVVITGSLTATEDAVVTFGDASVTGTVTVGGTSTFGDDATFEELAIFEPFLDDVSGTTISGGTVTAQTVVADTVDAGQIDAETGLTVSGQTVATGTTVASINDLQGAVTIAGAGAVVVTEEGQIIVVSGTGAGGGGGGGGAPCYTHEQLSAQTTWTIEHNFDSDVVNYIVFDGSDSQIYPDSFSMTDSNNAELTFVIAQDGKAAIWPCVASSGVTTLQEAYDNGDGTITTTSGKPVVISGVGEFVAVTGTFTEGLTVGEGSTHIDSASLTTGSGIFTDQLTVSGIAVDIGGGGGSSFDPSLDQTITGDWDFTESLTISGVPVSTGTGGGGSALTVKEADGDPTVTNVDTIVVTNGTLTDDGSGQITIDTGGSGGSGGLGQVAASGTLWMPEIAPASGTVYDDEFVEGEAAYGAGSIWTLWDPGTNLHTLENDEAGLYMRNSNATGEWLGIFQDVPPDGATGRWVAWAYVSMSAAADLSSGYRKVGFAIFDNASGAPTTTDFQFLGLTSSPNNDWAIERGNYTGYTDTTPSSADFDKATTNGLHLNGVFLRVIKTNDGVSNHVWEMAYSFDGVGWKSMNASDPGYDVAQVGIVCVNGAGTTLYRYGAKFFRIDNRYNGAGMRVHPMMGNYLDPTGGGGSSFDPAADQTITGDWDFSNSLTVSGVPVSTGTGAGSSIDETQVAFISQVFGG